MKKDMKKLSIIIPAYNEEKTLSEILRRVKSVSIPGWETEIIVVNDASTDSTRTVLDTHSDIVAIHHDENRGKGSAVATGLSQATGDYILIQDADLEYDPAEIPLLISSLRDGVSMVYGSRNLHHEPRHGFWVQRAGVWFITKLINVLYGVELTDVWTCYKLFPNDAKKLFVSGRFESELVFTVRALRGGHTIGEAPISHTPRDAGEGKKIRYRDGVRAILHILSDRLLHLRGRGDRRAKDASSLIVDPVDKKPLTQRGDTLVSVSGVEYLIDTAGRPHLVSASSFSTNADQHESGITWLKSFLKQFPILYYTIWHIFCPVLMLVNGPRKIRRFIKQGTPILDIGSGPERLGKDFINVDIFPFPEVDIVADASVLPFRTGSVDAMVSESVFEHVPDASRFASEMARVLAPGGYMYVSAPFIHPYHTSPDDFNRWTMSGLKYLFRDLEIVESGVRTGPWSALLMFLAYWLGVILSFGSRKLAPFITHALFLVIGPLKFLDLLFMWIPGSEVVATHLYILARKKS